jgi:hypothetical protein
MSVTSYVLRRGWPFLLGVLLIGTISYIVPAPVDLNGNIASGQYIMEATGDEERIIYNGPVYFEYSEDERGVVDFEVFKLHFLGGAKEESPGFGFLIPLADAEDKIHAKTYKVDPESKGFMNGHGSVFGYADFKQHPAALYFADKGRIAISEISSDKVNGKIDIVLDNGNGDKLRLEGRFKALPMPSSIQVVKR